MRRKKTIAGLAARAAAQDILDEVLRKRRALNSAQEIIFAAAALEPRDAGFARAIASETLRRLGQLQALIAGFVPKAPAQHRSGSALEILLAGACELLFLKIPPHAVVDAANELAARDAKALHFRPLINAVLRRVALEGEAIVASQDAAGLNTPDWLRFRWCAAYGEETARDIAAAHLQEPFLDVHSSPGQTGLVGERIGDIVRLQDSGAIGDIPGYREGAWWIQDFAATLPARLLGTVRGRRVIDLCAAPGGKTFQLISAGAKVTAVERDPARMQRLEQNLARLRFEADLVACDIRDFCPERPAPFVLLDAPCSATGTIRRHPDLPWIKSAADVNTCADAASELLDAAASMVAVHGLLVFAVCSLEPEEGCEQVRAFLARHPEFQRVPIGAAEFFGMAELIRDDDLRTLPCHLAAQGGMDGFYAARLRRSA